MGQPGSPVGSRLVLLGAIVYLLEWAVIIPVTMRGDFGAFGPGQRSTEELVQLYRDSARPTALLAAWLAVVLLGRIVLMIGIRDVVRATGRPSGLADAAVAVMAVSVAIEVASFSLVPAAGFLAAAGGDDAAVVALDAASYGMYGMVFAPLGVAVILGASALVRSGAVAGAWGATGVAVGGLVLLYGLLGPATDGASGPQANVAQALAVGVPLFWLWILALGAYLYRRAGRSLPATTPGPAHDR